MIHIDGSQKSGSGTIVRYATSLAVLVQKPLHLVNIRAKRENPGLRPQHLKAVEALRELSGGKLEGAEVGSSEIFFRPGRGIRGGRFSWDIGTAGSTTMLALTLLPVALFASEPSTFRISGGLFQDFAPSAFHMKYALFPLLRKMGCRLELRIVRPGYVPKGGGIIELEVKPVEGALRPIRLEDQGEVRRIWGIALSSHLKHRKVSDRMAEACSEILRRKGFNPEIEVQYDTSALQSGAALAVFAHTSTGCIIGADRAGELRRSSEEIGRFVAKALLEDLSTGATVDRFLADQLILFAALAEGESVYRFPYFTDHMESNIWLVREILGAEVELKEEERIIEIRGVGYRWRR